MKSEEMLSEAERREIEDFARDVPVKRAACLQALKVVQKNHRWVSDENLAAVAGLLDMTAEELDGVATFYSHVFRKPVGAHVISICEGISCWVLGYEDILEHLKSRLGVDLGETTADGRFTLLPSVCLGACDRAPAMMVDEELFDDLTPERIDDILKQFTR